MKPEPQDLEQDENVKDENSSHKWLLQERNWI